MNLEYFLTKIVTPILPLTDTAKFVLFKILHYT